MKIRTTKRYVDRYSKKIIEKGTVLEVKEDRAEELIRQKAAERIKASPKAAAGEG